MLRYVMNYASPRVTLCTRRIRCIASKTSQWYDKETMSFSCTQCGKCCRGNGNVYVNNAEIKAISNYLNISEDNFRSEYMSTPYTIRNHENFDYCKLFDGKENKCTVYPHRPTQCRTYPFWPHLLVSKSEWVTESEHTCEGMSLNPEKLRISSTEVEDAQKRPTDGIVSLPSTDDVAVMLKKPVKKYDMLLNSLIHMLHNRAHAYEPNFNPGGVSISENAVNAPDASTVPDNVENSNFTYDEAFDLLTQVMKEEETTQLESGAEFEPSGCTNANSGGGAISSCTMESKLPTLLSEFEQDFFRRNVSECIFSDEHYKVIDTMTIEGEGAEEMCWRYRRLEYSDSPEFIQTQVLLRANHTNANSKPDSEPVFTPALDQLQFASHRIMGDAIITFLKNNYELQFKLNNNLSVPKNIDGFSYSITNSSSGVGTKSPADSKVLVIGSAGCALPSYILDSIEKLNNTQCIAHLKGNRTVKTVPLMQLHVDVVDILPNISQVAYEFFGIDRFCSLNKPKEANDSGVANVPNPSCDPTKTPVDSLDKMYLPRYCTPRSDVDRTGVSLSLYDNACGIEFLTCNNANTHSKNISGFEHGNRAYDVIVLDICHVYKNNDNSNESKKEQEKYTEEVKKWITSMDSKLVANSLVDSSANPPKSSLIVLNCWDDSWKYYDSLFNTLTLKSKYTQVLSEVVKESGMNVDTNSTDTCGVHSNRILIYQSI